MIIEVLLLVACLIVIHLISVVRTEGYYSCNSCNVDSVVRPTLIKNPFYWPHSGTGSIDEVLNQENNGGESKRGEPLLHQTEPDHVPLTN